MGENTARLVASSPWTILVAFVVVDCAKHALWWRFDLEPLLALQRAIKRASRSLARRASRADATYERRVEKLRARLAALEARRTPATRAALRCAHGASAMKAVCGLAFAGANARAVMFALPSACAWPMGKWLSFGLDDGAREDGCVGGVAWTMVSAAGVDAACRAFWTPAMRAMRRGGADA